MLAMAAMFALPLPLTLYYWGRHKAPPKWESWLGNSKLVGVKIDRGPVPFTLERWFTAEWQRDTAQKFNGDFAARELYIRCMDELSYRFLRMSPIGSANILVGGHGSLFEGGYLHEYSLPTFEHRTLAKMASDVKRLQDECAQRGVVFLLLITPSKAAIYPEDIPLVYRMARQPGERAYEVFTAMLKEQGVQFVDGHALTMDYKARSPLPAFPVGGVHWNVACAATATNALLAGMKTRGMDVPQIDLSGIGVTQKHAFDDDDLVQLANLVFDWNYPVAVFSVPKSPGPPKYNLVAIGGSFTWRVMQTFAGSEIFSQADFYYYYHQALWRASHGELVGVSKPAPPMDFAREIYGADCVVLEVNETTISSAENNITAFVPDALANLPAPGAPRQAFPPPSEGGIKP